MKWPGAGRVAKDAMVAAESREEFLANEAKVSVVYQFPLVFSLLISFNIFN